MQTITVACFFKIQGHLVIGVVKKLGPKSSKFKIGERVGVAWIYHACGKCKFCLAGFENLCSDFLATGRDANGGYADYMLRTFYIFLKSLQIPGCAIIMYRICRLRSVRLALLKEGMNLGLTSFGASAHFVLQMANYLYPKVKAYVFTTKEEERSFAKELGAFWVGESNEEVDTKLDRIIDTTPAWLFLAGKGGG